MTGWPCILDNIHAKHTVVINCKKLEEVDDQEMNKDITQNVLYIFFIMLAFILLKGNYFIHVEQDAERQWTQFDCKAFISPETMVIGCLLNLSMVM